MGDFEMAWANALRIVIGLLLELNGCFFHFTQALLRNVQFKSNFNQFIINDVYTKRKMLYVIYQM